LDYSHGEELYIVHYALCNILVYAVVLAIRMSITLEPCGSNLSMSVV